MNEQRGRSSWLAATALVGTFATSGSALAQAAEPAPAAPAGTTAAPAAPAPAAPAAATGADIRRDPRGIKGISPFWESLKLGDSAYLARDYENAIGQYQDAISKDPQNPLGHLRVAETQFQLQKFPEALQAADAAKRFGQSDPNLQAKALFLIAMIHETQGELDQANEAWKAYQAFAQQQPKAKVHQRTPPERQKRIQTAKQLKEDYAAVKERIAKHLKEAEDKAKKNAK